MEREFHRIRRLPPYLFAEVNEMKARARAAGEDVIDFGMGNPDRPTPPHIVEKMIDTTRDPRAHRYSTSRGIPGLRRAIAAYYDRRFGVEIDPEREAVVTLGSKEGLANLAQAISSPGDIVLVPNPSYPIHPYGFIIAGASARHIPVGPGYDFMAELERAARHSVPPPTALLLNYPSNPTAEVADLDFYGEVVEFCRRHGIWIISDLAYAEIYFDGRPPPSVLQAPGAREVAVEFTSLSKTYSMPGWRVGFCVGNARLVSALARVKSYLDYGAFTPIQVAATAALNGPAGLRGGVARALPGAAGHAGGHLRAGRLGGATAAGRPCSPGRRCPPALAGMGSLEFSKLLLREAKVAVSPGVGFGEYGEGFVAHGARGEQATHPPGCARGQAVPGRR